MNSSRVGTNSDAKEPTTETYRRETINIRYSVPIQMPKSQPLKLDSDRPTMSCWGTNSDAKEPTTETCCPAPDDPA